MCAAYQTFVASVLAGHRLCLRRAAEVLLIFIGLQSTIATAADYNYRTTPTGDVVLTLSGVITPIDASVFLAEVNRRHPAVVELDGPGGDMLSAARIGVIINERAISTHAVGDCLSACAYIWIAGRRMIATEGVEIANHLPAASGGPNEGIPQAKNLAIFGWYLGRLNLSIEMMDAFLNLATRYGTETNEYFDMLAFAQYWNAPVTVLSFEDARLANAAVFE